MRYMLVKIVLFLDEIGLMDPENASHAIQHSLQFI